MGSCQRSGARFSYCPNSPKGVHPISSLTFPGRLSFHSIPRRLVRLQGRAGGVVWALGSFNWRQWGLWTSPPEAWHRPALLWLCTWVCAYTNMQISPETISAHRQLFHYYRILRASNRTGWCAWHPFLPNTIALVPQHAAGGILFAPSKYTFLVSCRLTLIFFSFAKIPLQWYYLVYLDSALVFSDYITSVFIAWLSLLSWCRTVQPRLALNLGSSKCWTSGVTVARSLWPAIGQRSLLCALDPSSVLLLFFVL